MTFSEFASWITTANGLQIPVNIFPRSSEKGSLGSYGTGTIYLQGADTSFFIGNFISKNGGNTTYLEYATLIKIGIVWGELSTDEESWDANEVSAMVSKPIIIASATS